MHSLLCRHLCADRSLTAQRRLQQARESSRRAAATAEEQQQHYSRRDSHAQSRLSASLDIPRAHRSRLLFDFCLCARAGPSGARRRGRQREACTKRRAGRLHRRPLSSAILCCFAPRREDSGEREPLCVVRKWGLVRADTRSPQPREFWPKRAPRKGDRRSYYSSSGPALRQRCSCARCARPPTPPTPFCIHSPRPQHESATLASRIGIRRDVRLKARESKARSAVPL